MSPLINTDIKDGESTINNTINIDTFNQFNINFGLSGLDNLRDNEYYWRYNEEIYNPVIKERILFEKKILGFEISNDIQALKDIYLQINFYFEEAYEQGIQSGCISEDIMSWDELNIFKINKLYHEYAIYHQRRQLGREQSILLRKIARYFLKKDPAFAKEVFEKIFEIKQELKSDVKYFEELNNKLLLN